MFYTCQVDCRDMVNYLLLSAILGNYLEGPLVQIKADKTKNIIKAATFRGHGGSSKTSWAEKLLVTNLYSTAWVLKEGHDTKMRHSSTFH